MSPVQSPLRYDRCYSMDNIKSETIARGQLEMRRSLNAIDGEFGLCMDSIESHLIMRRWLLRATEAKISYEINLKKGQVDPKLCCMKIELAYDKLRKGKKPKKSNFGRNELACGNTRKGGGPIVYVSTMKLRWQMVARIFI